MFYFIIAEEIQNTIKLFAKEFEFGNVTAHPSGHWGQRRLNKNKVGLHVIRFYLGLSND